MRQRIWLIVLTPLVLVGCGMTGGFKTSEPANPDSVIADSSVSFVRVDVPDRPMEQLFRALANGPILIAQEKYTNSGSTAVELEWTYDGHAVPRWTIRLDRWVPKQPFVSTELMPTQERMIHEDELMLELVGSNDDSVREFPRGSTLRQVLPKHSSLIVQWQVRLSGANLKNRPSLEDFTFSHPLVGPGRVRVEKIYTDRRTLEALDWVPGLRRQAWAILSDFSKKPLFEVEGVLR